MHTAADVYKRQILAIAALLLGAGSVKGCDIDPKAPDIAMENAALNGIYGDRFEALYGDILSDSALQESFGREKYNIITANIVADVIIAACRHAFSWLAPDGTFICLSLIHISLSSRSAAFFSRSASRSEQSFSSASGEVATSHSFSLVR